MKSKFTPLTAVAAAILAIPLASHAAADGGYVEEWRVMGPAFSYHGNKDQARRVTEVSSYNCRTGTYIPPGKTAADGEKLGIPARVCNESSEDWNNYSKLKEQGKLDWDCNSKVPWTGATAMVGGKSVTPTTYVCRFTKSEDTKQWHQNNPALGLEYTHRYDDHSVSVFGTVVRDSYGTPSLMAGASYMWPLATLGSVSIDGGIAAGLWYRSVINTDTNRLSRTVLPWALPVIAATESSTGLGVEFGLMPKLDLHINGRQYATPMTLMVQLTYLIKKTEVGETKVNVQRTAGGGLQASLEKSF